MEPAAVNRCSSPCKVQGAEMFVSCPATLMVNCALSASGVPVKVTLVSVITGNSAALSTAAPSIWRRVPNLASGGMSPGKSPPSSRRASGSSTTKLSTGTFSENDDAEILLPICTSPAMSRLTMTWLWPRFANGPARYTRILSSEFRESIVYAPGGGSDCRIAAGGIAGCGADGRGRGAPQADKINTTTATAILLNTNCGLADLLN